MALEVKGFDVKDGLDGHYNVRGKKETFPEQATRYAWHLKVDWVVLTDFREIRLYNSYSHNPSQGLTIKLRTNEYLEVAHKLSKRIANIKFVELRKIHYNVMSRVMDMNEADILAGRAKSVSARHYALYYSSYIFNKTK